MNTKTNIQSDPPSASERILQAAMETFIEHGYSKANTLRIATRARVSKRELYALFGSKQAMLAACITNRVQRMQLPTQLPAPRDREELASILSRLGASVLREVSDPGVVAVFRLAILEAQHTPEVATTLQASRRSIRAVLRNVLVEAQSAGLIAAGDPGDLEERFFALLWGDLMLGMLLRTREGPVAAEIERRARNATADFLDLHATPNHQARL